MGRIEVTGPVSHYSQSMIIELSSEKPWILLRNYSWIISLLMYLFTNVSS